MSKIHHVVHLVGSGPGRRNVANAEFYARQARHALRQAKAFAVRAECDQPGTTGKVRGYVALAILELERKAGRAADEEE